MSDKRAFEAKLDAYGDACYRREHSASARAAVLAAYDAAAGREGQQEPVGTVRLYPANAVDGAMLVFEPTNEARLTLKNGDKLYTHSAPKSDAQDRCDACDGTLDDHYAPDQGGCPGFRKDVPAKSDAAADWVCVPRDVAVSAAAEIEQMMDQEGCAPALRPMRAALRTKLREAAASPARVGDDKDGARWAFLRDHGHEFIDGITLHAWIGANRLRCGGWDKTIDAAMSREAQ